MTRGRPIREANEIVDLIPTRELWLAHPEWRGVALRTGEIIDRPRALIAVRSTVQIGAHVGIKGRPSCKFTRKKARKPSRGARYG